MSYAFYLDGIRLPIAPERLMLRVGSLNRTVRLVEQSEVVIPAGPGLCEVAFEARFPSVRYPFAVYERGFKDGDYYLERIRRLKNVAKPFQFIVTRSAPSGDFLFDTNLRVVLEEYESVEQAEQGADLLVRVQLREYRAYGSKIVKNTTSVAGAQQQGNRQTDAAPAGEAHRVVKGDCLWNLAQQYLGNGGRYMEIYNLNKAAIDGGNRGTGNPKFTIYPGQTFQLPPR